MFCPRCREEYREGFDWCRDCDVALVESLPSGPNETLTHDKGAGERRGLPEEALPDPDAPLGVTDAPPEQGLVTVGTYLSPIDAHGGRMELEQAGLRAWVLDEATSATFGVGVGARLQVAAEDEASARAILAAGEARDPRLPPEPAGELEEVTDAIAEGSPGEGTPEQKPLAPEEDGRAQPFARLELLAVVLLTSVYPILSAHLREADETPTTPAQYAAGAIFYAGLTFVAWMLLRRWRGPLSPAPPPDSATEWAREIVIGVLLCLGLWILHDHLNPWLRYAGVPDAASGRAAFFRQPGMAWVYPLPALVAALYQEVVFRAYLISRLPLVLGGRRVLSVVAAAALFAAMHHYEPRPTLMVFFAGLVYGFVYLGSRRLPRLVLAHWLYNLSVMWFQLGGR